MLSWKQFWDSRGNCSATSWPDGFFSSQSLTGYQICSQQYPHMFLELIARWVKWSQQGPVGEPRSVFLELKLKLRCWAGWTWLDAKSEMQGEKWTAQANNDWHLQISLQDWQVQLYIQKIGEILCIVKPLQFFWVPIINIFDGFGLYYYYPIWVLHRIKQWDLNMQCGLQS